MVEKAHRLIKFCAGCLLLGVLAFGGNARAEAGNDLVLISDAETQNYLAAVVKPLYQAAGVTFNKNNLFIVADNSLNAFVSDGNYMFVHTGTLLAADNTNELAGILAHETGHIMGGHIVRQKLKLERMQYVLLGSMIVAGATAAATGRGDAAMAVILGSQSSAVNHLLHHQIQEERSADESAVKLLGKTKQSTNGLLRFMQKIKQHNLSSGISEADYFSNHPLTSERIAHFAEVGKQNKYPEKSPLDSKFALVKAKLSGFMEDAARVKRRYPNAHQSAAAEYAHSILNFRQGRIPQALQQIDDLIKKQPQNPYFYELKGQFLFESGRVGESIAAYEKALTLLPETPLLQLSLAHALLENSPNKATANRSITLLQKAQIAQPTPLGWQLLARAYDIAGQPAASYYAAAEYSYAGGNLPAAYKQIERAEKNNPDKSLSLKLSDLKERIKADAETYDIKL